MNGRNTRFNFGFDEKPAWVKRAEADELARQQKLTTARRCLAEVFAGVDAAAAWQGVEEGRINE